MKLYVTEKTIDSKTYYMVKIGLEAHYKPSYVMWVHHSFVKTDENGKFYVELPVINCQLAIGKKETTLVLRPGDQILYKLTIDCGYRGNSVIEEIETDGEEYQLFKYYEFVSERGNLGVSEGVLILTQASPVKVYWSRDGKLDGKAPAGVTVLYKDGVVDIYEEDDDG